MRGERDSRWDCRIYDENIFVASKRLTCGCCACDIPDCDCGCERGDVDCDRDRDILLHPRHRDGNRRRTCRRGTLPRRPRAGGSRRCAGDGCRHAHRALPCIRLDRKGTVCVLFRPKKTKRGRASIEGVESEKIPPERCKTKYV